MKAIFVIAVAMAATGVQAQDAPRQMTSISSVKGNCEKLVTPDTTFAPCHWALISFAYSDTRSSFSFFSAGQEDPSARAVSFSGNRADETANADGTRTRPIDLVVTGTGFADMHDEPATGQCTFADAGKGPAHIHCEATTTDGSFSGDFTTDGAPPDVRPLQ